MNDQAARELTEKTLKEMAEADKPQQRSRVWKNPNGFRYLTSWSNAVLLRYLIRLFTNSLPRAEYRRKAQVDDAARSVVRNQEEGYKRSTTSEYLQFVGYSQGSLEEVKGDIRELTEDGFLKTQPRSSLVSVGINLGAFNQALRPHGQQKDPLESFSNPLTPLKGGYGRLGDAKGEEVYRHITVLYSPLSKIQAQDLSFEIFLELINKTDWLLRKLVESLEKKLNQDEKYYQVEQVRLRKKARGY